jgi:plasmid stability protein
MIKAAALRGAPAAGLCLRRPARHGRTDIEEQLRLISQAHLSRERPAGKAAFLASDCPARGRRIQATTHRRCVAAQSMPRS